MRHTGDTGDLGDMGDRDGKANRQMQHDDNAYGDLTRHDLTHSTPLERDIALLLADAADDVTVGIAPYQAVLRGGRRRRTRRWAVAAAAAVVIAGTTGTLAVATVSGEGRVHTMPAAPVPTERATPDSRTTKEPSRTTLAQGRDRGRAWRVTIEVWAAPKTEKAAERQLAAMGLFGDSPTGVEDASELVGKSWHFVRLTLGGKQKDAMIDGESDTPSGTDLQVFATPFGIDHPSDDDPERLVVGQVAPTAQEVRVTWTDGTFVDIGRQGDGDGKADPGDPRIVEAKGAKASWFVALAPEGVGYQSAEVTR
ncbi:hypothetical protein [Streptomyces scabiei]|uniref:hypothetical protein n=1 Tax=Streptomyces scabiei TaxID=1930 RepID=UPI0029BEB326|nr:hypothetical protein [Streptomyces scabiei]MDX3519730.1 hypothetical protein [Streptomyces scabiei]